MAERVGERLYDGRVCDGRASDARVGEKVV